ncbi:MAG: PD40 domain-containing protein [Flavobacteriales bacterium]|nr:PD40 domain-containing protein [Flavobacteriales bacterium]
MERSGPHGQRYQYALPGRHTALSADGNTFYFVSNRDGGQGGRDIHRVVRLPTDNGARRRTWQCGEYAL